MSQQQIGNFQIAKFDGKNFTVWASSLKDILVQSGLLEVLEGERPSKVDDGEWAKLERKTVSTIRLCLSDEVKHLVLDETSPTKLWAKLEEVYMQKSLANKWVYKKEILQLKMQEGDSLQTHLSVFNRLAQQLASVDAKLSEEDKVCLLFASMPVSWNSFTNNLLLGKKELKFEEAVASLLQIEKQSLLGRAASDASSSFDGVHLVQEGQAEGKKKSRRRLCFRCDKEGHFARNCPELKTVQAAGRRSDTVVALAEAAEDESF